MVATGASTGLEGGGATVSFLAAAATSVIDGAASAASGAGASATVFSAAAISYSAVGCLGCVSKLDIIPSELGTLPYAYCSSYIAVA